MLRVTVNKFLNQKCTVAYIHTHARYKYRKIQCMHDANRKIHCIGQTQINTIQTSTKYIKIIEKGIMQHERIAQNKIYIIWKYKKVHSYRFSRVTLQIQYFTFISTVDFNRCAFNTWKQEWNINLVQHRRVWKWLQR